MFEEAGHKSTSDASYIIKLFIRLFLQNYFAFTNGISLVIDCLIEFRI